ncbi:MAG: NAD-dependent epimerase/dehydratase family protein [Deltaproteobacteria bacterium]|jgi:nucleoside-diphosphate-sugar epimerase|nr:NAD-dependent epimerase/dehydratase family protein [Deltaproteobacteria bacterium]MBW1906037.1 NAD-dependent epimerase/dehydratase family protein [Deltaproteobacteria bacterium]MBW2190182.1 NAD-dependent epimerase/dehydratase family protein [Deltaproteobacteria bacterium]MBW2376039.1 NAD-dependent epimerase/dehydratase family protein [Deltaproteobacteria bacterium]MBW2719209.1 NAD-dependent epimerase/dehydratase family protein [Deltaproteobacteria bacterium]
MPIDVLVTGSAGFIGGALVERLRAQGTRVAGADLRDGPLVDLHFDVTDDEAVRKVFEVHRPRIVVHAAAIVDDRGDPALFETVNVGGTRRMLEAARSAGCRRFVQLSSIAALGVTPGKNTDVDSPLIDDTGSPYFDTKARSERIARSFMDGGAMEVVVVRPGDVYGPGSVPWVERPLELMRKHQPVLIGGGRGLICHCHIENLVDGIELAMTHDDAPGGIFIIHDGSSSTTFRDYFTQLARAAGISPPRVSLPKSIAYAVARLTAVVHRLGGPPPPFTKSAVDYITRQSTYSIEEARRTLGYQPRVTLAAGMAALAEKGV